MPVYKPVKKDVKYYVEEGLRKLGWKVNSNIQEKYAEKECAVIYSDFENNIDTNMSYWDRVWIKIIFDANDNATIPDYVTSILHDITGYVEKSAANNCTSFVFGKVQVFPLGMTNRVEMTARYAFEVDWVDEI